MMDNTLGDSKPCCMCVNLMKLYGVKRVYYSDSNGNICYQKIDQLVDENTYMSHGLKRMAKNWNRNGSIFSKKLPLTRAQKTFLIHNSTPS